MTSWSRKEDISPYETIEFIISGIIPITLIMIGTFGNVLSVMILLNKQNQNTYLLKEYTFGTEAMYRNKEKELK